MRSVMSAIAAVLVALAVAAQQPPPTAAPLPLDPITPEEERNAVAIAQGNRHVRELLGSSFHLVYALSIAPKLTPNDNEPRGRHADLLYIRSERGGFGVRVLVDLIARNVVSAVRVARPKVPLGTGDVEDALRVALQDPALRELLGAHASSFHVLSGPIGPETVAADFVEGMHHVGVSPTDPCTTNRCVILLFNSGGHLIMQDRQILVDLDAQRVRVNALTGGR